MVVKITENVGEYWYMIKAYLNGVNLFDHYVSVIIYEFLAKMFPSRMVMSISLNNNIHNPFVSCFIRLRTVAKLLKRVNLTLIFPERKPHICLKLTL
jgi:hypothetical protein